MLVGLVALVLPSALYGCVLASPWCLEKVTARYAFFVCCVLSVLLAVEFGALVKASDFCEARGRVREALLRSPRLLRSARVEAVASPLARVEAALLRSARAEAALLP